MTRRFVVTGLVTVVAAMATTTLVAAIARAAGVTFELPDRGEPIPLSGFAFVTGVFSLAGLLIAAALRRWSRRPAERFVQTTGALTLVSLVPPFLVGATASTAGMLVLLHLVAAAVVIPTVARSLRTAVPAAAPA